MAKNTEIDISNTRNALDSALDETLAMDEFSHMSKEAWAAEGQECTLMEAIHIAFFSWLVLSAAINLPGLRF